jgi:cyclophilin family peptidyl-prolyl cis-trans isomerase
VLDDNDDPHSARASFFVLLGDATHLDGKYTVVGRVARGLEVLDRVAEGGQPAFVETAGVVPRAETVAAR